MLGIQFRSGSNKFTLEVIGGRVDRPKICKTHELDTPTHSHVSYAQLEAHLTFQAEIDMGQQWSMGSEDDICH